MQFISCLESPAMRVNNVAVRVVTHTHLKQIIGPLSIISAVHRCLVLALVKRYLTKISIISTCNIYNICAGADPGQDV